MLTEIKTEDQYKAVMKTIEELLEKATKIGGFHKLGSADAEMLADLSKVVEAGKVTTRIPLMCILNNVVKK